MPDAPAALIRERLRRRPSRGRLIAGAGLADAHRLSARPRPHRPFDRFSPPRPQDAGVRPSRGRPFPHPPDPYDRGRADRPRAGPGARRSTTTSPRRSRLATTSATRRSAIPARTRSTPAWPATAASITTATVLRIVTELERRYADFDGLNLTQETVEGLVKHNGPLRRRRRPRRRQRWRERGIPAGDPRLRSGSSRSTSHSTPASRRRRRRSPTTSPIMPTTSTTACAPGLFSARSASAAVPFIGGLIDEIEALHPGLEDPRGGPRTHPPRHHPLHRGRDRREPRGASRRAGSRAPRCAARRARTDRRFPSRWRAPIARSRPSCSRACIAIPTCSAVRDKADAIVRRLFAAYRRAARRDARRLGGAGALAGDRERAVGRLYRRHDRPFRGRRTPTAF